MITFVEFFGTLLTLGAGMILFMIRMENRLTKFETKLDNHLKYDCDRDKPVKPPL